jgi:hypothetical protein
MFFSSLLSIMLSSSYQYRSAPPQHCGAPESFACSDPNIYPGILRLAFKISVPATIGIIGGKNHLPIPVINNKIFEACYTNRYWMQQVITGSA